MRHNLEPLFAEMVAQVARRSIEERIACRQQHDLLVGVGFDLREQIVKIGTNHDAFRCRIRDRREQSLGTQQYFGLLDDLPGDSR